MTPNLGKIPAEIKALPQWVSFRADKTPVNPKTGGNAKADDSATWGAFDQAVRFWETHQKDGIAGIGYEFHADDPFCGTDIDNCRDSESGELKYCARVLIEYLDSYHEASPSGTGVHGIVKARWPANAGNKKKMPCGMKVEVYDRLRYFTMTGAHLPGTPTTINDRQAEVTALHRVIFRPPQKPQEAPTGPTPNLELSDQTLIDKAHQAVNGDKFSRLWAGTWHDYPSESEATAALLNILVFWCGPDPERIDRLFRQSGLMRGKWDRPQSGSTWGAIEIQTAIDRAAAFYTSGKKPQSPDPATATAGEDGAKSATSVSPVPVWPNEVMAGAAGMFARTYSAYLETPESFLYMNYLTLLGHLLCNAVTLQSEIRPQPRLYTVSLGESADVRKSTAISKTYDFFHEAITQDNMNAIWGVGSAEGLAKAFGKNNRAILVLDELKSLVQKMRIDGSVLLPCVNTLFESNRFHSLTKCHDIKIDAAGLCLLAASTLDTYANMFTPVFMDIGFINRLFIVIGDSKRKFSIPAVVPEPEREALKNDLREVLKFVGELSQAGRYAMPIDQRARAIFDEWYFTLEHSVFAKRLDTYGHRLMPLLAVNKMKETVTPEVAERVVALLNYQLAARKFADPIDADNAIARLEERIRRLLANGTLSKRDLERRGSKNRVGIWVWNTAINNLIKGREVIWNWKDKTYSLAQE